MNSVFEFLFDSTTSSNYAEFILIHEINDNICGYSLDKDLFMKQLKYISKLHSIKYFTKKIKRYRVDDMTMEICDNDIKVFKSRCYNNCVVNDNLLCLSFQREKQPYHQFPCTRNINEILFVHRYTFRLHNRLFLNFEIQKTFNKESIFKVYMNYNHDKSTEINTIASIANDFIKSLLASTY